MPKSMYNRKVGLRIRKYREDMQMVQKEVAQKLNVSESTIAMWELGERSPSIKYIVKLSLLYHCTTDDILMPRSITVNG